MSKPSALDLSIRESILQVIKAKAIGNGNVIHSSDFRTAITELGYPMGSTLIENILVFCKLDKSGYIDFSELQRRLQHERTIFNSQQDTQLFSVSSNSSLRSPTKANHDLEYIYKVESDQQLTKVTENSKFIKEVYNKLNNHEIDGNQACSLLESIDIPPTKEFLKVAGKMEINHVPYAEFILSITKFSPKTSVELLSGNVAAGGYKIKPALTGESIGSFRKRTEDQHPSLQCTANKVILQHKSGHDVFVDELIPQHKPMRKMMNPATSSVNHKKIFEADQVKEVLFGSSGKNNNKAQGDSNNILFSSAQQSLINGVMGGDVQASFTIEQKLQREQISAALRKLDANQITFFNFQDLVRSMGINIPDNILIDIKRSFQAGCVDVRKHLKLLDATVFKISAIEECVQINEKLNGLKRRFREAIIEATSIKPSTHRKLVNYNVINELYLVFLQIDEDHNGMLTFTEFRNVCCLFKITETISETELKVLFHSLDHNGDGLLSFQEFISVIRGESSSSCIQIIQKTFQKLDRFSEGKIPLQTLHEEFQAQYHPMVVNGYFSEDQLLKEMKNYFLFDKANSPGYILHDSFENYFCNLAAAMDSDDAFVKVMNECWSLHANAPAPPVFRLRHGTASFDRAPMAIQTHGDFISWQQDSSMLEDESLRIESQKGKKKNELFYSRNNTDVINWKGYYGSEINSQETIQNELRAGGIASISKGLKNQNSLKNLLEWNEQHKSQKGGNQSYDPPLIASTIFPVNVKEEIPVRYQRKPSSRAHQSSFTLG